MLCFGVRLDFVNINCDLIIGSFHPVKNVTVSYQKRVGKNSTIPTMENYRSNSGSVANPRKIHCVLHLQVPLFLCNFVFDNWSIIKWPC